MYLQSQRRLVVSFVVVVIVAAAAAELHLMATVVTLMKSRELPTTALGEEIADTGWQF